MWCFDYSLCRTRCEFYVTGWNGLRRFRPNSFFALLEQQRARCCLKGLNPFHPDCKTVFIIFFPPNFQVYFSIFKTWAWLPPKIPILFYIKNNQSNTLKCRRCINWSIEMIHLGGENGPVACRMEWIKNLPPPSWFMAPALHLGNKVGAVNPFMNPWKTFCPPGLAISRFPLPPPPTPTVLTIFRGADNTTRGGALHWKFFRAFFSRAGRLQNCWPEENKPSGRPGEVKGAENASWLTHVCEMNANGFTESIFFHPVQSSKSLLHINGQL